MELEVYDSPAGPGWKVSILVLAFYAACLAYMTYPRVLHLADGLPNLCDPVVHLWTMRFYKTCLVQGTSPLMAPGVHYPVGAPLGYWPSMHYEALIYIPLSFVLSNDILIYNILQILGLLLTGMATYLLAWHMVRHRAAAAVGGMLGMLGPTLGRAFGHLEYLHGGWFALFLLAWLKFVDRPTPGRLARAAGCYTLMGMATQYYALFGVFPGALYVMLRCARAARLGQWSWIRARLGWLAGFSALTAAGIGATVSPNLWALKQGVPIQASLREGFDILRTPLWAYVAPAPGTRLGDLLPFDPYTAAKIESWGERYAYLGVASLFLMYFAASRRAPLARRAFWWSALATLVLLSMGAFVVLGPHKLRLPADWLWNYFPPIRMTRAVCRASLLASICAAVLAASGLRALLERLPNRPARAFAGLAVVACILADCGQNYPLFTAPMPRLPAVYAEIARRDPRSAILEGPMDWSDTPTDINAACTYWQTVHGLSTSAGYGARKNRQRDELLLHCCPFNKGLLESDQYLAANPDCNYLDIQANVDFRNFLWLYLTRHGFDHVVIHPSALSAVGKQTMTRVDALIGDAKIADDADGVAYALGRMRRPTKPTLLHTTGWRGRGLFSGRVGAAVAKVAGLTIYNPDPGRDMQLEFAAMPYKKPREVCLRAGDAVIKRWHVEPGSYAGLRTDPFRLPAGMTDLVLEFDGEEAPANYHQNVEKDDPRPYAAIISTLHLFTPPQPAPAG